MVKWTRERIIRELLNQEAAGLPLSTSDIQGRSSGLYQAATRIFGSWRNTLTAAGIAAARAQLHEPLTPARIISRIRALARKRRTPASRELSERHSNLVRSARRCFGSWPRAVIAAGIDPTQFHRVPRWTKERIIEAILQRALNNERLGGCTVRPQTLATAAIRIFGSWTEALVAAGLNPKNYLGRWPTGDGNTTGGCRDLAQGKRIDNGCELNSDATIPVGVLANTTGNSNSAKRPGPNPFWSGGRMTQAIILRVRERRAMNAAAVCKENRSLYRAALKQHGSWRNALLAAGLNPDEFVGGGHAMTKH